MKEVELWLRPWKYNRAVLLNCLVQVVIEHGGTLLCEKGWKHLSEKEYEIHRADGVDKEHSVTTQLTSFAHYILDGALVYIQLDDNIFESGFVLKERIGESLTTEDMHYLDDLDKEPWWDDKLLTTDITGNDFKSIATRLFETINCMPLSKPVTHKERRYFPDNSGKYFYVTVIDKRKKCYEPVEYRAPKHYRTVDVGNKC